MFLALNKGSSLIGARAKGTGEKYDPERNGPNILL